MPDEYIRRAEALEITTRTCGDYAAAFAEIRKLPAADVVEVVRRGHCKYKRDTLYCRLRETPVIVSNADFCSHGRKRTK